MTRSRVAKRASSSKANAQRLEEPQGLREIEEKYRRLFENPQVCIGRTRLSDGLLLEGNVRLAEVFGYDSPEEMCGRFKFGDQAVDPGQRRRMVDKLAGKSPFLLIDDDWHRKDGSIVSLRGAVWQVGERDELEFMVFDVTEEKRAEAALRESEAKFRSLAEGAIAGIHIHRNFRPLFANQAYADIFGYGSPDEILALDSVLPLIAPPERDRLARYRERRMAGKSAPSLYEYQGLRKDGTVIWLESQVTVVDWDGEPATQTTLVDITERKRAEESVEESEREYRELVELIPGAVIVQCDGRITYANKRACEMFGAESMEAMLGLDPLNFVHPEMREFILDRRNRAIAKGRPVPYVQTRHLRLDGSSFYSEMASGPVTWHGRVGTVNIIQDITERKTAEQEVEKNRQLLGSVMDAVPYTLSVKDLNQRFLYVNKTFEDEFGVSEADVLGQTTADASKIPSWTFDTTDDRLTISESLDLQVISEGKETPFIEVTSQKKSGDKVSYLLKKIPLKSETGEPYGVLTLYMDVSEQKEIQDALRASEERYRKVFEHSPLGMTLLDTDLRFLSVNPRLCDMLGYSEQELVGRTFPEFTHPDDIESNVETVRDLFAGRIQFSHYEKRFLKKNGEILHAKVIGSPVFNDDGAPLYSIGLIEDITEQKRTEQELERNRQLLISIMDAVPYILSVKDVDRRFLYVNKSFEDELGVSEAEVLGRTMSDAAKIPSWAIDTSDDQITMSERLDLQVLSQGKETPFTEVTRQKKSGDKVSYLHKKIPLKTETGKPYGVISLHMDVSEQKEIQDALKASEERYRKVFEYSPLGMCIIDLELRFLTVNPKLCDMLGYSEQELVGHAFPEFTYPDDVESNVAAVRDVFAGRTPFIQYEKRYLKKNGDVLHAKVIGSPVFGEDGAPLYGVVMIEDITEQKRAEQEIEKNRQLLSSVMDAVPYILSVKDVNRRFLYVNKTFEDELGVSEAEVLGRTLADVSKFPSWALETSDDQVSLVDRSDEQVFSRGKETPFTEITRQKKSGDKVTFLLKKIPLKSETGEPYVVITLYIDVSEQKEMQDALKASEERYRKVFEYGPLGIAVVDRDFRYLTVNAKLCDMLGYSERELVSRTFPEITHPDDVESNIATTLDLYARRIPFIQYEKRYLKKNGEVLHVHLTSSTVFGDDGVPLYTIAMMEDITDRKRAERKLRESEERYTLASEGANDALWDWDLKADKVYRSTRGEMVLGFPDGVSGNDRKWWIDRIHPDDRAGYRQAIVDHLKGKTDFYEHEYRVQNSQGDYLWALDRALARRDENGIAYRMVGSWRDVTERKQAEEDLKQKDARLRSLQAELTHVSRASTMGELSAAIAHELNQPLTAVINYIQASEQLLGTAAQENSSKLTEYMGKAVEQAERAATVISRLKNLFERGELTRRAENINDVIEETSVLALLDSKERNIEASFKLGKNLPKVLIDKVQVQQTLLNLIRNAVDAMTGAKKREITIRTRKKGDHIEVTVSDKGRGLPKDIGERLFDPFFTTKSKGTGVGLSICKSIVEAHGGKLTAAANPGGGAVFRFTLPIAADEGQTA